MSDMGPLPNVKKMSWTFMQLNYHILHALCGASRQVFLHVESMNRSDRNTRMVLLCVSDSQLSTTLGKEK